MKRFFLPFLIFFIFISESIFVDLVSLPFALEDQLYIPRFLLIVILFVTAYLNRTQGMLFGFVFGLLQDIVYIEVIGIYLFAYSFLAYLVSKTLKVLHKNVLIILFLTILAVALIEFYVYGMNYLIGNTNMPLYHFTTERLLPTLALNSIMAILLILPVKRFLEKIKKEESDDL